MLDGPSLPSCIKLGDSLATASWFSVTYELMARFPGCRMKDLIMNVLGSMICRLERGTLDENVKQQFTQLPSDPQDLLVLLALSSIHDLQLQFIQFAVIKILYFSHIYTDRFTEESHVLACLEQYLLMNFSALNQGSCSSCIIKQLLYIHIRTKETANLGSLTHSLEAESLLASLVEQCLHTIISSNMHRSVFTWLTRTESLESFMVASILEWIKTYEGGGRVSNEKFATYPRVEDQEGQPENLNLFLVALEEEDCCGVLFTRVFDEVLASQIENDISRVVSCYIKLVKLSALAANQLCLSGIVSNIRSWLAIYGARLPRIQGCLFELLYQLLCAVDHDRALDEESWGLLVNQFVHPLADSLSCLDDAAHKEGLLSLLSLMGLILHKSTENTGFLTQASGVILSHEQLQNSIKSCLVNFGAQGCKLSDLVGESSDGKILACVLASHLICLRWLLYFGSSFVKLLSSSCQAEAFSWLTHPGKSQSYSEASDTRRGPQVLQSTLMVLQGSILDSCEVVCRNSSFCLYSLLVDINLNFLEKAKVFESPWHRFLLEEFVLAVSAPNSASSLVPSTIYMAIGLLKQSLPPIWTKSVLKPCILALISCLTAPRISPATIVLLKELHGKGWLEVQHLETIYKALQTTRKIVYGECANLDCSGLHCDQCHTVCSSVYRQDSDAECLLSHKHLVNMAASYVLDPLTSVRYHIADPHNSSQLVSLIDEFLQERNTSSLG
ncbi:hypothetical protein L7F22_054715 [Adiantum nelumboides]|nr:hypothetical protein [Adiantum nelumboides]